MKKTQRLLCLLTILILLLAQLPALADGYVPLTQQETFNLPKTCQMQVRVKFTSGDVIGSPIQQIDVLHALSKVVL